MIKQVSFENFRGQTKSIEFGQMPVFITGPNGAGKSTIIKAVEICLNGSVSGDDVDKRADAIYAAYCGEDDGQMEVSIETHEGTLMRRYTQHKGKVTTTLHWNGEKVRLDSDIHFMTGVRLFMIEDYRALTPTKQVSYLCQFAGIDPAILGKLDKDLKIANDSKRKADAELKQARQALKANRSKLQTLQFDEGADISRLQDRLKELAAESRRLHDELMSIERANQTAESNAVRVEAILKELKSLSGVITPPPQIEDGEDIEAIVKECNELRELFKKRRFLKQEIEELSEQKWHKAQATRGDEMALVSRLEKLRSAKCADTDEAIYQWATDLWKAAKSCGKFNEDVIRDFTDLFREQIAEIKDRIEFAKQNPAGAIADVEDQLQEVRVDLAKQDADDHAREKMQAKKQELEQQVAQLNIDLNDIEEPTKEQLTALNEQLAIKRLSVEQQRTYEAAIEDQDSRRVALNLELLKIQDQTGTKATDDLKALQKKNGDEFEKLTTLAAEAGAYQSQRELVADSESKVNRYSEEVARHKAEEKRLQAEKTGLLDTLQEKIQGTANKILSPYTVSVEISAGSKGGVNFWVSKPDGIVKSTVLSGAEMTEFHTALSTALLQDFAGEAVVYTETDALDTGRLEALLAKAKGVHEQGVQMIMLGHQSASVEGVQTIHLGR